MRILFFLLSYFPLTAMCQVSLDKLQNRNGQAFEAGAEIPFTGTGVEYFPDGSLKTSLAYKEGYPDGALTIWYSKDKKQVEGFLVKGQKTGIWTLYYPSGKLNKQTSFLDNKENGEEMFWFENGNLAKKGTYEKGILEGRYQWYYENGKLKQEGHFRQGKEEGSWKDWYESGAKKMTGQYLDFEKDSTWIWYDDKGNVSSTIIYKNGVTATHNETQDSYLEKANAALTNKDLNTALENINKVAALLQDKTANNPEYMNLRMLQASALYYFSHTASAEKLLLTTLGLSELQAGQLLDTNMKAIALHLPEIKEDLLAKERIASTTSHHVLLALLYNMEGDTINLGKQQQLAMDNGTFDWILQYSLGLYRMVAERSTNLGYLEDVNAAIRKEGAIETLELPKAEILLATEDFTGAAVIIDKYLAKNGQNLNALLLKMKLEMALGHTGERLLYENRIKAIDPKALEEKGK